MKDPLQPHQEIIKTINHASDHLNSFQEPHFDEYNQDYGLKPKKISFQDNEVSSYRTVVDMEIENVRDINDDLILQIGQTVEHKKFGVGTIQDIDGTKAYIDDILVVKRGSFDEHLAQLDEIFRRCQKANIKMNALKCRFGLNEIDYLGYIVTPDGLRPNPKKIQAIQELKHSI